MKTRWPRLTELQIAVLACVRDDEVEPYTNWKLIQFTGYEPFNWRAHGFDVTIQIKALRARHLIVCDGHYRDRRKRPHYGLSEQGVDELQKHSEF